MKFLHYVHEILGVGMSVGHRKNGVDLLVEKTTLVVLFIYP